MTVRQYKQPVDYIGNALYAGDKVVQAIRLGNTAELDLRTIAKVEAGKVYLMPRDLKTKPGQAVQNLNRLVKVNI